MRIDVIKTDPISDLEQELKSLNNGNLSGNSSRGAENRKFLEQKIKSKPINIT